MKHGSSTNLKAEANHRARVEKRRARGGPTTGSSVARGASWGRTFLLAGVACIATFVYASMIRQPDSMVGAIRRVEANQAAWGEIEARFKQAMDADANGPGRGAVAGLLNRVHAVATGRAEAGKSFDESINYVAADPVNLVSRIAYSLLQDMKTQAATQHATTAPANMPAGAGPSVEPMARFLAMREIVEGARAVNRAAVYNASLFDAWRSSLDGYFVRPDVAASLGMQTRYFMRGDLRNGCWTVLPMMADRMKSLSIDLKNAGHANEAEMCDRWLGSCSLGILRTEKDAPTQLLAADLLARAATGPLDKGIREGAERFRLDFQAAAEKADVDFCDQGFVSAKSVAPAQYRTATTLLVVSGALAAMGAGAGLTFLVTLIVLPFVMLIRMRRGVALNSDSMASRASQVGSPKVEWFTLLGLLSADCGLFAYRYLFDRYYSESAAIHVAIVVVGAGGAIGLMLGSMRCRGRAVVYLLMAFFAVLIAMPVSVHAWTARFLSLKLGSEFVAISIVVGLIATAAILSGASLREIAHGSAKIWLIGIALGVVAYFAHAAADKSYSEAAVSGYADEVAARLGADWQQTYFKDAIARYDLAHP